MHTGNPTWEQLPGFVATIHEDVAFLKEYLTTRSNINTEAETPISLEEAATFLQLEPKTLYNIAPKRLVPCHKQGRKWYFFKSELVTWIKSDQSNTSYEIGVEAENLFLAAQKKKGV